MTERGAAVPQDAQITPSGTAHKVTAIVRQAVPNASGGSSACRLVDLLTRGDVLGGLRVPGLSGMGRSPRCVVVVRMAEAGAGVDGVAANRELWTQANSEYTGVLLMEESCS